MIEVLIELNFIGNQLIFYVSDVICLCEISTNGVLAFLWNVTVRKSIGKTW